MRRRTQTGAARAGHTWATCWAAGTTGSGCVGVAESNARLNRAGRLLAQLLRTLLEPTARIRLTLRESTPGSRLALQEPTTRILLSPRVPTTWSLLSLREPAYRSRLPLGDSTNVRDLLVLREATSAGSGLVLRGPSEMAGALRVVSGTWVARLRDVSGGGLDGSWLGRTRGG
ncbi:hypothetical protein [Actinoplanes sp. NPDC049265]|uniref:hypothetical protein n=1 Tax=Actinoplanes sp. NPDC049265 TaxID=3363902 RepID=UPI00371EED0E